MKVSLNWAQWHSNVDLKPNGVDDLVQKIGQQLGAVEEVIDTGAQYQGVIVVKIVSCEKHPNADKLNVCWIDDDGVVEGVERNGNGYVQVVCGAPNVREGLTVAWIPPGATVPSTYDKEPFVLGARELRGVVSNGMLASASELALSDDHSGILEIEDRNPELLAPGTPFSKLYGLDDVIIDIENKMFTHRPDCFGAIGVAREIAGIYGQAYVSPDWYRTAPVFASASGLPLRIENEIPELVPRFMAVAMKDVTVAPSPMWLQAGLARVGMKSINNVVDITNYLMYMTGQPLHAYDYDKVAARSSNGAVLVARKPAAGEKLNLLNGKTIEPRSEAIVIATDKELVGVGGVMGGADTEVDESTKSIIIECANFDMYSIRRTSMTHGLFTDAVTRFNKGQSPLQNDRILAKAMELMTMQAGAAQASDVIDNSAVSGESLHAPVTVSVEFINQRLGLQLNASEITSLLTNVEFAVSGELTIAAPFWRTDIAIPEDVVEEVGRLKGFDALPLELPQRSTTPAIPDPKLVLKQQLRTALASFGANEVLTYSFVHGKLIEKAAQNTDFAFKLTNAISPELQYYRMSLTPSLLAHVQPNSKAGNDSFSLFEINKTHSTLHKDDDNGVPKEIEMVALVTAAKSQKGAAYFQVRAYLDELARTWGVKLQYAPISETLDFQVTAPFEHTRSALVSVAGTDIALGIVGEYKQSVAKALKLPAFCAGFEIGLDEILQIKNQMKYTPLSRYPSISQDICLEVADSVSYGHITELFEESLQSEPDQVIDWRPIDIYQAEAGGPKRFTYHVTMVSYERTLTESVLTSALAAVAESLAESIQATQI